MYFIELMKLSQELHGDFWKMSNEIPSAQVYIALLDWAYWF